jgi:hypothetical protein
VPPTLHAAFGDFLEHLNGVLAATITTHPLQPLPYIKDDVERYFAFAGAGYALIKSEEHGNLALSIGQCCALSETNDRLCTLRYTYGIGPTSHRKPTIRWDYRRTWPEDKRWCRHHFQGREIAIQLGRGQLDANMSMTVEN